MRRGIAPIVGSHIADVRLARCSRRPIVLQPAIATFRRRAAGQKIVALGRAGKRVLVHLASGDAIVFEPRMSGLVLLGDPPTREHLRVRIGLRGGPTPALWYWDRRGLGSVRLLSADDLKRLYGPEKLGPDALNITASQLRKRLADSRRPIKVALLDQRAVAGIGNLYAAEILHQAGIHPERRACDLKAGEWPALAAAVRKVLRSAIHCEGSTLADGTYRNALNKSGGYQHRHRVYARAGKQCHTCGKDTIQRIVQAQRSTFFCAKCQPISGR